MDTITLYYSPMTRAERVKRLLEAFEIPHETKAIDYQNGEQKSEEYKKIHPLGRVPALSIGEQILTESGAICLALADLFPEKSMAPSVDSPERRRYYEWAFLLYTSLEAIALAGGDPEKNAEAKDDMASSLKALLPKIETPFVFGDQFSAIDVMIHTELYWYKMLGIYPDSIPEIDSYYNAVESKLAQ
ncbi:MAG: glutathione S-transferase family protein [Planctomycetota bacterium]|nr:glutathione S-transferase family protein [Planctomycetota bacterium]